MNALRERCSYAVSETIWKDNPPRVTYKSHEKLLSALQSYCPTRRTEILRFLPIKHLLNQLFESLITEFGQELAELGGILVFHNNQCVYSAASKESQKMSRVLVIHLEDILNTGQHLSTSYLHIVYVGVGVLFCFGMFNLLKQIWR